jgi:hypothetical protein
LQRRLGLLEERSLHAGRRAAIFVGIAWLIPLVLSLLTASRVSLDTAGIIRLTAANLPGGRVSADGIVCYDADRFAALVETIPITDTRMSQVWGECLYRILLSAANPKQHDTWKLEIHRINGNRID